MKGMTIQHIVRTACDNSRREVRGKERKNATYANKSNVQIALLCADTQ